MGLLAYPVGPKVERQQYKLNVVAEVRWHCCDLHLKVVRATLNNRCEVGLNPSMANALFLRA